ncbi:hypothetical protein TrCOL_g4028 [Triparma columacea]|uniref:Uncharacterized protein n=1 Tax=Triparma columacea TaxID=722753 RepID=A0A9W7LDP0_9STRA|nr:hypothetical protein TrCOL_g4028 [Triparma columacea]
MGWSKWKRKWKHAYRDVRRELIYEVYVNQVEKMYPGWMAETYGKEFTGQFHIKNGVWDLKRLPVVPSDGPLLSTVGCPVDTLDS